jgi:sugar/nucleoside kinase (ribokinase family)
VVEDNLAFLTEMVREYVDIVFANEEEAQAFTGSTDPREALLKLAEITELAVVKIGKGGSLISHKGDTVIIKIDPVESIDSTGAGDLYAAGFLFGYIQNQPMKVCGELGSLLAGSVIQGIGAKIPEEKWEDILRKARRIMD